jgi:hypothetical protein
MRNVALMDTASTLIETPVETGKPIAPDCTAFGDDDQMLDIDELCIFWGGKKKPISKATAYREIKAGRIPPGRNVGPNTVRFSLKQQRVARARMFAEAGA